MFRIRRSGIKCWLRLAVAMTGPISHLSTVITVINLNVTTKSSWRGGVNYLFDNGVTPYFSYSESFEPASELMRTVIWLHLQKANSEVGVKCARDRPIVVTGALYQLTKTNNLMADPNGSLFSVEGGEIRAWRRAGSESGTVGEC